MNKQTEQTEEVKSYELNAYGNDVNLATKTTDIVFLTSLIDLMDAFNVNYTVKEEVQKVKRISFI